MHIISNGIHICTRRTEQKNTIFEHQTRSTIIYEKQYTQKSYVGGSLFIISASSDIYGRENPIRKDSLIILSMPYLRTVRDLCGLVPGMVYAGTMDITLPGTFMRKKIPLQSVMILSPNYIMTLAGMSFGFLQSRESVNTILRMNNLHVITSKKIIKTMFAF